MAADKHFNAFRKLPEIRKNVGIRKSRGPTTGTPKKKSAAFIEYARHLADIIDASQITVHGKANK